jgi:biopolymer transport protein ExbD
MVFKKGQVSLNKGKIASEELRKKLSEAHKGIYPSEETKRKRSESMNGKNKYKRTEETRKKLSEAHKGQVPYMLGKKHTPESLLKMSLAHKGKTAWNKGKTTSENIRKKLSEAHLLLTGGVSPINERIRKSILAINWREAVFKRDNWTCCICKNRGGKLNAHHIQAFSKYPELRFAVENGLTLCRECHKKTENYGTKSRFK